MGGRYINIRLLSSPLHISLPICLLPCPLLLFHLFAFSPNVLCDEARSSRGNCKTTARVLFHRMEFLSSFHVLSHLTESNLGISQARGRLCFSSRPSIPRASIPHLEDITRKQQQQQHNIKTCRKWPPDPPLLSCPRQSSDFVRRSARPLNRIIYRDSFHFYGV
ncbi:hypothetical protein F5Y15DRAFT_199243 [Xylariaceae sp. FL0016]|nr:hypothetical protein F5Y15DRAFT_199243 [Xylariaceae sp. FL0016]